MDGEDAGVPKAAAGHRDDRWNYWTFLGQGVLASAGYELTSDRLVLPFLYTAVGAPVFFAGLLVPLATLTRLAVQIVVTPVLHFRPHDKWSMALALLASAVALVLICTTLNTLPVGWLVVIFLFVASVMGASSGVVSLVSKDLLGRLLPANQRSRLVFAQSGLAGTFAVIVAIGSKTIHPPGTSMAAHQELIWLGIILTVLAAVVLAMVREPVKAHLADGDALLAPRKGRIAELRENFASAFALPWFVDFLVARTLFLSIELAMPFYSIHAATFHGGDATALSTFVIAASGGLVVGGIVWPFIRSTRLVMMAAAAVTFLGGVLALTIELLPALQTPMIYAVVFVLVGFGGLGIVNGRTLYVVDVATDSERPFSIAVSNVVTGVAGIVLGAIVGSFASLKGVAWPIAVMMVLNIAAIAFTTRLRGRATATPDVGARPPD